MATRPASQTKKKSLPNTAPPAPEALLRALVGQLPCTIPDLSQMHQAPCEEVILDTVLDGAHYLLVRLPQTTHHRVQLSPREQEIVRMVAQGHPNKVIADVLNISSWTVCTHLRRIFAKLGVGSRAAMVARILENGNGREPGAPSYFPSNNAAQPKAPSKQSSIPTGAPLAMTERREAG